MYLNKIPNIIKPLAKDLVFSISTKAKIVYLTFDDGPTPGVTEPVLEILDDFSAKATFFCIGKNVKQHYQLYKKIMHLGHAIGNHSFGHENGWKTEDDVYFQSVAACHAIVPSKLFRPPYGRITKKQVNRLKQNYTLVMWDVLSGDFDPTKSPENCTKNVLNNVSPGSIIVFHDSLKAKRNVLGALPDTLESLSTLGYSFEKLPTP